MPAGHRRRRRRRRRRGALKMSLNEALRGSKGPRCAHVWARAASERVRLRVFSREEERRAAEEEEEKQNRLAGVSKLDTSRRGEEKRR